MSFRVCGEISKPNLSEKRIARRALIGSSTKLRLCSIRIFLLFMSSLAPKKSITSANSSGFKAMASVLIVKSLR